MGWLEFDASPKPHRRGCNVSVQDKFDEQLAADKAEYDKFDQGEGSTGCEANKQVVKDIHWHKLHCSEQIAAQVRREMKKGQAIQVSPVLIASDVEELNAKTESMLKV